MWLGSCRSVWQHSLPTGSTAQQRSMQIVEHVLEVRPHLLGCHLLRAQRGVDEQRPQEGATNPDGHHVCEHLASRAQPGAVADLVREVLDLVEHLPHLRHHIRPICVDLLQGHLKTVNLMR